jgi:predicted enzyme related to lactoylglutathione lyase
VGRIVQIVHDTAILSRSCQDRAMAEFSGYTPGTPCWVDLGTPDVDASVKFYGDLFGWEADDAGPDSGGYRLSKLHGKQVAGVGPLQDEQQPPAWTSYVWSDDADATAEKVKEAGGQVFMPPFDVMDAGRMTVSADPTGAILGVWQPNRHRGAELANEAGTFCWSELHTRGMDKAKGFYEQVFGWETATGDFGGQQYTEFKVDGKSIAGGMEIGEDMPAEIPPHWIVYFATEDTDATVEKAKELGGSVWLDPMDSPAGRFAGVSDPQGARFSVIQM